ncbi:unnamed protein product [Periconia digitata]|uniref:Uncharacterized protein n=1 Tax=Periconia digitata TaxID=1303443 RepID=A0A9W4XS48_9PLEO|nr:unnamed protein product [Periconia digitata]
MYKCCRGVNYPTSMSREEPDGNSISGSNEDCNLAPKSPKVDISVLETPCFCTPRRIQNTGSFLSFERRAAQLQQETPSRKGPSIRTSISVQNSLLLHSHTRFAKGINLT